MGDPMGEKSFINKLFFCDIFLKSLRYWFLVLDSLFIVFNFKMLSNELVDSLSFIFLFPLASYNEFLDF